MATAALSGTTVRRHPERAAYERGVIEAILDESLFCHVGFIDDGRPVVIPTIHARVGRTLYLHGSPASRMLRELAAGIDVCVTATLLDGLVLARSAYNHSLNYRSAVVFGRASPVTERDEKQRALAAIVEHIAAGRGNDARPPNDEELAATAVLAIAISEASAKTRTGPPRDFDDDLPLPIWAGVVPLRLVAGPPETEERVPGGVSVPRYATAYERPRAGGVIAQ